MQLDAGYNNFLFWSTNLCYFKGVDKTQIYYGGSFFPPHLAHTEMLQRALKHDREAELVIVPTKQNPLKNSRGAEMALIQAWLEDLADSLSYQEFSRCRLETYEMLSPEKQNYSVDTLQNLVNSGEKWVLLLGSDSASSLTQWKSPDRVLSLVNEVWVVPRGEYCNTKITETLASLNPKIKIHFLDKVSDISSTHIRSLKGDGTSSQSLEKFLSPRVLAVWKQLLAC